MKYKIEIGDSSGDGHGISEVLIVQVNKTADEIAVSYRELANRTGVCLFENVCRDYGEETIDLGHAALLLAEGIPLDDICEYSGVEDDVYTYQPGATGLVRLYLEMAKVGLMDLEYSVHDDETPSLTVFSIGYGLYGH